MLSVYLFHVGYSYAPLSNKKQKENPLPALTGPDGSRSLRLPDVKTIGT
jgi:hypothetical protein